MSAYWFAWLGLLPIVALNARRWLLLRSYRRVEQALAVEGWRIREHGGASVRRLPDLEYALGRTRAVIARAERAPLWRWTP